MLTAGLDKRVRLFQVCTGKPRGRAVGTHGHGSAFLRPTLHGHRSACCIQLCMATILPDASDSAWPQFYLMHPTLHGT
eukprot:231855-Chlamydomonas_euryale.AAC.1